jgi:hypothetical protein
MALQAIAEILDKEAQEEKAQEKKRKKRKESKRETTETTAIIICEYLKYCDFS